MDTEEMKILEMLKKVIDPELMVNIIDLGLVYGATFDAAGRQIDVALTLTSPGCPMGGIIIEDAQQTLESNHPGFNVNINLVWEPAWSIERLSAKGKAELGFS